MCCTGTKKNKTTSKKAKAKVKNGATKSERTTKKLVALMNGHELVHKITKRKLRLAYGSFKEFYAGRWINTAIYDWDEYEMLPERDKVKNPKAGDTFEDEDAEYQYTVLDVNHKEKYVVLKGVSEYNTTLEVNTFEEYAALFEKWDHSFTNNKS